MSSYLKVEHICDDIFKFMLKILYLTIQLVGQNGYKFIMSNLANYSPYNKSYKFILLQNQAYHQRNKRNAAPLVRTNLRHSLNRKKNPQNFKLQFFNDEDSPSSSPHNLSQFLDVRTTNRSVLFDQKQINKVNIDKPKRIVHKNWSYQKINNAKINTQNSKMVNRLLESDCQIITKQSAINSWNKHRGYAQIRRKYTQNGIRKDYLPMLNYDKLCPTLKEFQKSGLADKFMKLGLSMSVKPSSSHSMRRSYVSAGRKQMFDN